MKAFIIVLAFVSGSAFANSMAEMSGKLVSITEKDFAIETDGRTYFIKKSALTSGETKLLKNLNKAITVHVPLDAVEAIKDAK